MPTQRGERPGVSIVRRPEGDPPATGATNERIPRDREDDYTRCFGAGKVRKLAEIVAATVLCGELSLGSAIVAEEWVAAHDLFGRNR
jgi:hypothetical protein